MNISIPQIVTGIISMFLGILAIRVVMPIVNPILSMTWNNSLALIGVRVAVYLVIATIIYVVIYGTVMGKLPKIIKERIPQEGESSQDGWDNDLGW